MTDLTDLEVEAVGVGDVRMVRSFRIGPAGQLYPVNSIDAWADGWNTAACGRGKTHAPPGPNCRCGFYLYSDAAYALAQPTARQVMAVVATHGAMEIGSRGARPSRARVAALWLGPRVSDQLTQAVSERHPTMTVFCDRTAMDQLLAAVQPGDSEAFDPTRFLQERDSLFLLASAVTSASCAPLVAAFVEDITETARLLAARSPGARLDPPLLLALDEIANLTPLPSLPSLMAEGGGTGITTLAVLQSLAQARNR